MKITALIAALKIIFQKIIKKPGVKVKLRDKALINLAKVLNRFMIPVKFSSGLKI